MLLFYYGLARLLYVAVIYNSYRIRIPDTFLAANYELTRRAGERCL